MSAHMTPEQVRSNIDHPIVDGDGHWVEYDPVFSDKMRKVGGDLAADGFLKAMGTTREALTMSKNRLPFESMPSWYGSRPPRSSPRKRITVAPMLGEGNPLTLIHPSMVIGRVSGTGISRGRFRTPLCSAATFSGLLAIDADSLRTLGVASRPTSVLLSARAVAFERCLSGDDAGFGASMRYDAEPPTHPSPNVPSSAPVRARSRRWRQR